MLLSFCLHVYVSEPLRAICSVSVYVLLCLCRSIYDRVSVCPSACLPASIPAYLPAFLSLCLSVCLGVWLAVYFSMCPAVASLLARDI